MNVLVTGTRAPSSMDIIRSLIHQGHTVYSADSMRFPLGCFVKGVKKHFILPKPNRDLVGFLKALKVILIDYHIDLLIPTCEEIFFVSQGYDELSQYTRLFCEPFSRLLPLHNKYDFNQLVLQYQLDAPASWLLTTQADKAEVPNNIPLVLKPIYSRFGADVIIKPAPNILESLPLSVPYIAQEFITGKEYCAYAIADHGKLLIHSCYHPKYTAGPAAGMYFEPVSMPSITHFLTAFCLQYQFTGQIAFDFIFDGEKSVVLECNPRATSGFHFIADHINWRTLLDGQEQVKQTINEPYMLGLGMIIHGFKYLMQNPRQFVSDYKRAHDVLKDPAYPWLGLKSLMTTANIVLRMVKERKSFHEASTDDIEFNGK